MQNLHWHRYAATVIRLKSLQNIVCNFASFHCSFGTVKSYSIIVVKVLHDIR